MSETPKSPERTPIPIERLLISHANPHGVKLPNGPKGESDRMMHTLKAGIEGEVRTTIEWRPWVRMYRVTRSRKIVRLDKAGKEVTTYEPLGSAFGIPESWAVPVFAEE